MPFLLFLILAADPVSPLIPQRPAASVQHYDVFLSGTLVGEQVESTWEMETERVTQIVLNIKGIRNGSLFETLESQLFTEALEGRPLSFFSQKQLAGSSFSHSGSFEAGTLHGTRISQSGTSTYTSPMGDQPFFFPTQIGAWLREADLQPGSVLKVRLFLPDFGQPMDTSFQVVDSPARGIFNLEARFHLTPPMAARFRINESGLVLKAEYPQVGLSLVYRPEPRESGAPAVIDAAFTLPPTGKSPLTNQISRMSLKISSRNGSIPFLAETSAQKLVTGTDGTLTLYLEPGSALPEPGFYRQPWLEDSEFFSLDEALRKLAREITGSLKEPGEQAHAIVHWVYANLQKHPGLQVGMTHVNDLLLQKQGDCSEHSLLTVALCRALGIPARAAFGLVYRNTLFIGHMWPEIYLDGWVPMDPTFDRVTIDATYLRIDHTNLNGDMTRVGRLLGQIALWEVTILEYEL